MFLFYPEFFILALFYIAPIYSTDGPPRMKFKTSSKSVKEMSQIGLKCRLCQSNPASTVEWLFNGEPLHFKRDRMLMIIAPCQQILFLLTVLTEDEGNYTCVAKNKFGEANSTTEVKIFENVCSDECLLTDGKRKVGSKRLGPPRMKFPRFPQIVPFPSMLEITCPLCESNPPSTLTWFYNGRPIDFKRRKIQVISRLCEEALYFRVLENDGGNYTCVATNDLGQAKLTMKIETYDGRKSKPRIFMKFEAEPGTMNGNFIKIGSSINITCAVFLRDCLAIWSWKKNDKLIAQMEEDESEEGSGMKECTTRLVIDKVMTNSTGKYQCLATGWGLEDLQATSEKDISISAVPCFKGFYCPPTSREAKRCPNGTFTMHQKATDLKQCEPCPATETRNETLLALRKKNPQTAEIFRINCPYSTDTANSYKSSSLSRGEIVAIAVSLTGLILVIILGCLYGMRNCRHYKRLVQRPLGDIQIEMPDVPQSRDVFVCYSSKNREWVHDTLLSNLRAQDFQTFIDFIDFEIGLPIHQNIVNGVYGSRKTIFVLSKDSLRSYYARTELSQALAAGRRTGHQVIVILYEKCKVPEEISNIVYLDWTDEKKRGNFWEKLYEAVRKPLENEAEV